MKTLSELVNHIKTYNDAVVIVGSNALNQIRYAKEEFNEKFSRKALKRSYDELWNFFFDKIYDNKIDNYEVIRLLNYMLQIYSGKIINQTTCTNFIQNDCIYLHGVDSLFHCQKCKTIYTIDYVKTDDSFITDCEQCDGKLRPNILLSGEIYDKKNFNKMKEWLEDTHTLILIGMDYTEEPLLDIISQYGDIKSIHNSTSEDKKVLVAIQTEEESFNPNDIAFCEFLVKGDIDKSVSKLNNELKK